ncbi:hypothetical protein DUNSADRAFT_4222 [Dunaliella salina]|uniref:Uncharacterized protein n=1 Tax=Dunaliella salina TaxID=3046 RepID=A0ABQ7GSD8_DUNSA|nr:hypothetical protein DUNSADRAFT_4222 [Dunaliella salina]|eukprot:KAF5837529.1 hypothetical protein DUNSADRAFT_4222 [Dunaliella salina]
MSVLEQLLLSFLHADARGACLPDTLGNCLITGPCRSRLHVLAATFAINEISGGTEKEVLFLSKKGALDGSAPVLPQGIPATHPKLARVKLRHLQSSTELQQYASCLHLLPTLPAAIIVVGISDFFSRSGVQEDRRTAECMLAKTLALLVNGVESIRGMSRTQCPLLVTEELPAPSSLAPNDDSRFTAKSLFILKRWLPLVLEVTESRGHQGNLCYALSLHPLSAVPDGVPAELLGMRANYVLHDTLEVISVS